MSDDGEDWTPELFAPAVDDAVLRAMRDPARRFVLYFLLEHDEASLDRLADVVAGWSAVVGRGMATSADRERALTLLHHRHLGVLEDAGLIGRDGDVVRRASLADPVRDLVRWAHRLDAGPGDRSGRDGR